jgi:hypothetical protein
MSEHTVTPSEPNSFVPEGIPDQVHNQLCAGSEKRGAPSSKKLLAILLMAPRNRNGKLSTGLITHTAWRIENRDIQGDVLT